MAQISWHLSYGWGKTPEKNFNHWPDRGSNTGRAEWEVTMLPLDHTGSLFRRFKETTMEYWYSIVVKCDFYHKILCWCFLYFCEGWKQPLPLSLSMRMSYRGVSWHTYGSEWRYTRNMHNAAMCHIFGISYLLDYAHPSVPSLNLAINKGTNFLFKLI